MTLNEARGQLALNAPTYPGHDGQDYGDPSEQSPARVRRKVHAGLFFQNTTRSRV